MNTRTFVRVRRSLAIIGILSILSTLVVSIPTAGAYSGADAKKAGFEWAEKAVDEACESELIDCSLADPKFSEVVNRAVGYQMLTKGFEVWSETAKSPLTGLGDWYDEAFHTAYTLGWTKGDPPPKANPGGPLTRAQLAVAAASVLGLEADEKGLEGYKDAKDVPSWAKGPMGAMVKAKLIGQGTDKMLNPNKGALKAEVIVVLNAQVKYAGDNEIDVLDVAAERAGVDADTMQEALDTGMNVVDGELVEVELAVEEDEEEDEEEEEEEGEEEEEEEEAGGEEEPGGEEGGEDVTPPPAPAAGTLTVSLASDTPASGTIIADTTTGDGAQALVHFTHLKFVTESGTAAKVTKVKLKRTGVSSDSDLSNLYLYDSDGKTRLAEVNNIASTYFTFENSSGLFTVTGEKTVYVVGDVANGTTGNKTIGLGLNAAEDVGTDATTVSGTFPATGNLMTTATVADLGRLTINGTSSPSTVDPGQLDFEVWRFNLVANDQDLEVNKLNLTLIGTVAIGDLKNTKIYAPVEKTDGTTEVIQLGATVATLNANNEAFFDLSSAPLQLKAGQTKTVTVKTDIIGGVNRNFRFAIRKLSDVGVRDKNYNVELKANQANSLTVIEPTTAISINSGKLTITRADDSPAATTANNANAVTLAKFNFKATGESIKIETIVIEAVVSEDQQNLNNGKLFVDGVQVGTTVDFDSDATDDSNFTDGATDAVNAGTDEDTSITLGNTFIIPAGTTKVLSLVADTKDGDGNALADSSTVRLSIGGITATGMISVATIAVSSADGNQLTAVSGALTTSKNISLADPAALTPTGVPGSTCVKVGSFVVAAGAGEPVDMTQIVLKDDYDAAAGSSTSNTVSDIFQNLKVVKTGASCTNPAAAEQIGSTVSSLTDTVDTTYTFSVSPALRIVAGGQQIFDVYADVLSSLEAEVTNCLATTQAGCTETDGMFLLDSVSGTGVNTSSSANDTTDRQLHSVILASAGSLTITLASSSPASTLFAGTNQEVELAHFNLKETTGAEGIKVTQVVLTSTNSSAATTFYALGIFADGVQLGGYQSYAAAASGTATFSGLSYVVPPNTTKTIVVKGKPVAYPSGTANSDHAVRIAASGITARGATSNTSTNGPAAAVTGNTHSWARTSLAATGGAVAGDCTTSCVRGSSDNIFSLGLTSGNPYGATLRGALQANDEADNGTDTDNWAGSGTVAVVTTAGRFVDGSGAMQVTSAAVASGSTSLMFDFGTGTHLLNYSKVSFWLWVSSSYGTATTAVNQWFFKSCVDAGSTTPANRSDRVQVGTGNNFHVVSDTTRVTCPQVSQINGGASFPASPNGALFYVELDTTLGATSTRWFGVEGPPIIVAAVASAAFAIDDLRLWNDSVTVNLSGSLAGTNTYMGSTTVEAVDSSNVVQLVGYVTPTGTTGAASTPAKAVLTVGRDIGNATTTARSDIILTTAATTYTIRAETDALMAADTTAAESLSVSIGLGNATSDGDIRWFDGAVGTGSPLTWASGTTPITVNYSY